MAEKHSAANSICWVCPVCWASGEEREGRLLSSSFTGCEWEEGAVRLLHDRTQLPKPRWEPPVATVWAEPHAHMPVGSVTCRSLKL